MKLAVIGSRAIGEIEISEYIPSGVSEIVSGGAKGIDTLAARYAEENNIPLVEFLPEYTRYGKGATHKRNRRIAEYADEAIALWDGRSTGTMRTVELFRTLGKKVTVIKIQ